MTDIDQDFRNYNLYRRLVRRALIGPYTHDCGTEMVAVYGEDDEFALKCYACNATISPSLDEKNRIRAIVKEHFDD